MAEAPLQVRRVTAQDGVQVPLIWFPASSSRSAFLMMPALGIQARMYVPLARALAAHGCAVALLEQRGHGQSGLRAQRGSQFGMVEFLDCDIPAALDWLQARAPGLPLLLGGHSLGGHMATLYAGREPERLAGVVHIATGAPYHGDFPPRQAWLIRSLCVLVSLFRILPGYFPGHRLGFAGRESLQLMRDWRDWALSGRLDFGGRDGLQTAVAQFRGPVLSISLKCDEYSSAAAVDRALAPFRNARITRQLLGPAEQNEFLGHFRWAREPAGVARAIAAWIEREMTGPQA